MARPVNMNKSTKNIRNSDNGLTYIVDSSSDVIVSVNPILILRLKFRELIFFKTHTHTIHRKRERVEFESNCSNQHYQSDW